MKPNSTLKEYEKKQLRWMVPDVDDLTKFPDFLVIGPQRTGSTWLHYNLAEHPSIMMSKHKEVRFFHLTKNHNSPQYHSSKLSWYLSNFNDPNPEWIIGEATPSYLVSLAKDSELLEELLTVNPSIKVITTIRNPIERAWSHAQLHLRVNDLSFDEMDFEFFKDFYSNSYVSSCADCANIDIWKKALYEDHVHVIRFDDIHIRPQFVLDQTFDFLGVSRHASKSHDKKINSGAKREIPEQHKDFLHRIHSEDIIRIEDRYGWTW